jgi:membrane protein DedA with SNARE-associated domain
LEPVFHWITEYGYIGIFCLLVLGIVGLPVPDETLLTFAGYLVWNGRLHAVPTALAAFFGSICGITLSYAIGRLTGYFLIEKYGPRLHITHDRVEMVHDWFRRLGRFTLTFGYFVPGVRHLTAYVAGASCLEPPIFAAFAYVGAALWIAVFLTIGYALGESWSRIAGDVHRYMEIGGAALGVAALAFYWFWRRRRREAA